MPGFENYTLREITVRKVDQFIKTLAATKSYSTAKQTKTVLGLALGLAVRYDALRENPVRDIAQDAKACVAGDGADYRAGRCDSWGRARLASWARLRRAAPGRSVGTDH